MTEEAWLACSDAWDLFDCIRGRVSDRKLRLLLCAWSRLNWKGLRQETRSAVELAERFADGLVNDQERRDTDAALYWTTQTPRRRIGDWWARLTLESKCDLWHAGRESVSRNPQVQKRQIEILRDIVPNPCRPPSIETPNRSDGVVRLAQAVYDERGPAGTLDPARLAKLADALEQASCPSEAILAHFRRVGPHVRGCYILDLLLGKS